MTLFFVSRGGVPTATSGGKRPQADSARVWGRQKRVFGPFFGVSHGSCVAEVVRYIKDRRWCTRKNRSRSRFFLGAGARGSVRLAILLKISKRLKNS